MSIVGTNATLAILDEHGHWVPVREITNVYFNQRESVAHVAQATHLQIATIKPPHRNDRAYLKRKKGRA